MDMIEGDDPQQPDPLKHPDLPLQYLAWLKANKPDKAPAVEKALKESGWLERRKQFILTRNEQGRAADEAEAPGMVMRGLDAAGDVLQSIGKNAYNAFLSPVVGETRTSGGREGLSAGQVITKDTPGAITPRDFIGAGAQTVALAGAPALGRAIGAAAPLVRKALPTAAKAVSWLGSQTPTISKVVAPLVDIAGTSLAGGINNSVIQGAVGLARGDEQGTNRLQEAAREAQQAFVPGTVGGAVLGTVGKVLVGVANKMAGKVKLPPSLTEVAEEVPPVSAEAAPTLAPAPTEMYGGIPMKPGFLGAAGNKLEKLGSDYLADIRESQPALHEAMQASGAARKHALYIKQEIIPAVMEGLDDTQREQFGLQKAANSAFSRASAVAEDVASAKSSIPVLQKELLAVSREAVRNGVPASEVSALPAIRALGSQLESAKAQVTTGAEKMTDWMNHGRRWSLALGSNIESEPWYQQANTRFTDRLLPEMTTAARGAGVSGEAMLDPADYLKMFSKEPLINAEIQTARGLRNQANAVGSSLRRSPLVRRLIGNPADWERTQFMSDAPQQGPINLHGPGSGTAGPRTPGASRTGSAREGTGTAQDYDTDFARVVSKDVADKIPRAANNRVYEELVKAGRVLGENENVLKESGEVILKPKVIDPATGEMSAQRIAVTPEVKRAWDAYTARVEQVKSGALDDAGSLWKRVTNTLTKLQISGMPVEAFSHMLRTIGHVGSNTGELDQAGKVLGLIPGIGGKAAAAREMQSVDFANPVIQKIQDRLSRIGALRTEAGQYANAEKLFGEGSVPLKQWWESAPDRGGILQWAHHALFGPEGVDRKARVVLALRAINRDANISDSDLRRFVNGQLGNYVEQNSGTLTNLLQRMGLSAFGRFQASSIPASIRRTVGVSDLPTTSLKQKVGDVAGTLWRGPVGYYAAGNAANMAMSGHPMWQNEQGHGLDIATGYAAVPGGIEANPTMESNRRKAPLYIPFSTIDPVSSRGLRATGMRQFFPNAGTGSDTDARLGDAARDVANTALGVLSPAYRAVITAITGRTPYLLADNSFLRVAPHALTTAQQGIENLKAAVAHSNPALEAVQEPSRLVQALGQDNGGGGMAARVAQALQILLPRMATVGVGGEQAGVRAGNRDLREYNDFLADAKRELTGLSGRPNDQQAKLQEFVEMVRRVDGERLAQEAQQKLMREIQTPDGKKLMQSQRRIGTFERKIETPPSRFPFPQ